jgi:hypothetical protein
MITESNGTYRVSVMLRPGCRFFAASTSGEVTSFPVLVKQKKNKKQNQKTKKQKKISLVKSIISYVTKISAFDWIQSRVKITLIFLYAKAMLLKLVTYRLFVYSRLSNFSAIRRLSPLLVTELQI